MKNLVKIEFSAEYFNVKDTLECGQIFRFIPYKDGFKVYSKDKCAYCYNMQKNAVIECDRQDEEYFYNFFDLDRDYSEIYEQAKVQGVDILKKAAEYGKGIRILNQDREETLFSFIVSQNNNIPRIKGIIEKLCLYLGDKKEFMCEEYFSFPKAQKMSERSQEFYKSIGLGYRAEYVRRLAENINNGFNLEDLDKLNTEDLKKALLKIHGVGGKVADCVTLFGFKRSDSFPVDTWIEKVYREDFNGALTDRRKITEYFNERFKEYAGYFQQYLFFYKRSGEKNI
ncbi:MAG: hypothetical protein E7346_00985 [Clostridiales bacterium]|nr:hypothetical protein [Clostridiales bacterium]